MKIIRTATVPMSLNVLLKGQLHYLNKYLEVIAVSGRGSELDEVKKREAIKIHPISFQRNISLVKDVGSLFKLYFYFKKEKPDIVHSVTPKAGLLSMLAAKFAGVPIRIHTFTGLIFPSRTGLMQKLLICMDQLLCCAATDVYPEGKGVKKDLIEYGITRKPLRVLANGNVNGIDSVYFRRENFTIEQCESLRQSFKIQNEDILYCFVGRLVKDKGIDELVDAFKSIHIEYPKTKLLLVGSFEAELDPVNPETEREIANNPAIISTGFQKDVRPYLAISDIFVFPSYREGFPNVVMQAGAMSLPSIVTDINGSNEIIVNGENGLIIPSKDTQALKEAMLKLLHNKDLCNSLAKNARPMIESRYQQKVIWHAILEEYNRLIAERINK